MMKERDDLNRDAPPPQPTQFWPPQPDHVSEFDGGPPPASGSEQPLPWTPSDPDEWSSVTPVHATQRDDAEPEPQYDSLPDELAAILNEAADDSVELIEQPSEMEPAIDMADRPAMVAASQAESTEFDDEEATEDSLPATESPDASSFSQSPSAAAATAAPAPRPPPRIARLTATTYQETVRLPETALTEVSADSTAVMQQATVTSPHDAAPVETTHLEELSAPPLSSPASPQAGLSLAILPSVVDAVRQLQSRLFGPPPSGGCIMFAGIESGSGVTELVAATVIHIAATAPQMRLAVVDMNLRRPRLTEIFEASPVPGVTELLAGGASIEESIRHVRLAGPSETGFDFLPAGSIDLRRKPQFDQRALDQMLSELARRYDAVLIDTPSIGMHGDVMNIAPHVARAVIVARPGDAQRDAVSNARQRLESVGTNVVGVVLNDCGQRDELIGMPIHRDSGAIV